MDPYSFSSSLSYYPNPNPNFVPVGSSAAGYSGYAQYNPPPHPPPAPAPAAAPPGGYYYYGVPGGYAQQQVECNLSGDQGHVAMECRMEIVDMKKDNYVLSERFMKYKEMKNSTTKLDEILDAQRSCTVKYGIGFEGGDNSLLNPMNNVGMDRRIEDLAAKKLKILQGGASAESVRVCTICSVVCNSDKVFASHIAGEKHMFKATGVRAVAAKSKASPHLKAQHMIKKLSNQTSTKSAKMKAKGLITFVNTSYCEICKVDCNSQEVLNSHKMGKKHIKNVQKLKDSITPKPAAALVTTELNKEASAAVKVNNAAPQLKKAMPPMEELEAKKQKVLKGGAAVDAVRVCGICNVVCNSESVFNSHIAGQKHITKLKNQQSEPS